MLELNKYSAAHAAPKKRRDKHKQEIIKREIESTENSESDEQRAQELSLIPCSNRLL